MDRGGVLQKPIVGSAATGEDWRELAGVQVAVRTGNVWQNSAVAGSSWQ